MKIIVPEFVLEHVRDVACDLVQSACDFVTVGPQGNFSGDISGAEVVVLPWQMPAPALQTLLALPTVRWIHAVSAGVDHALDDTLRGLDVVLTNARGVFDLPIAETVLAYILMITKHMPAFFVQQQQHVWRKHRLREAAGLTVGIVGLG
ncbi:MAG: hypothetical protein JXB35_15085, partial [Anaerolineae bacterium]|nr:hypothetical protein [Anaerolineae bacterium]